MKPKAFTTNVKIVAFVLATLMLGFTPIAGAQTVTKVAGGFYHSLFLKNDGSLWVMGDNSYGELGDGTFTETNRPEQIVASNVTAIAAGDGFSLFLKGDGSLWTMGYNANMS